MSAPPLPRKSSSVHPAAAEAVGNPPPASQAEATFRFREELLRCRTRPNVLLVGPREATAVALRELDAYLIAPIHYWEANGPLILPLERSGTLVLQDIGRLTPAQQDELFDRLGRFEYPMQVVSVAIQMPFVLVMSGQFREDLYYRLNTMLFEL